MLVATFVSSLPEGFISSAQLGRSGERDEEGRPSSERPWIGGGLWKIFQSRSWSVPWWILISVFFLGEDFVLKEFQISSHLFQKSRSKLFVFYFSIESYRIDIDMYINYGKFKLTGFPSAKEMAIARPLEGHCAQIDCNHRWVARWATPVPGNPGSFFHPGKMRDAYNSSGVI